MKYLCCVLPKGLWDKIISRKDSGRNLNVALSSIHFLQLRDALKKMDIEIAPLEFFKEQGIAPDLIVFFESLNRLGSMPKSWDCKKILIISENEKVNPKAWKASTWERFDKVLSWKRGINHIKYGVLDLPNFSISSIKRTPRNLENRKQACAVLAKKPLKHVGYRARALVVNELAKSDIGFDLFGQDWDRYAPNNRIIRKVYNSLPLIKNLRASPPKSYRGACADKMDVISQYNFNVIIENELIEDFFTEKIFHSCLVGTVPIYLGATNIEKFLPTSKFIDLRDFFDGQKFDMVGLGNKIKEFESDLDGHVLDLKKYIASPDAYNFSTEKWVDEMSGTIRRMID